MSPIYEYACPQGHTWAETRSMVDRDEATLCRDCGEPGERVLSLPQEPIVRHGTRSFHAGRSRAGGRT